MHDMSQIQRALDQAAREHARIEKLLSPSLAVAHALRAFDSPQLRVVSEFAAAMKQHESLFAAMIRPSKLIEDIQRQIAASHAFMDGIVSPFARMQESIRRQASVFESLASHMESLARLKLTVPQLSQSVLAWECAASGLTNRMRDIGLLAQRDILAHRLFAAPIAYTDFVTRTTDLLAKTQSEQIASRLRGSLHLAESQLLSISGSLSNLLVVPEDTDEPVAARRLCAPFVQQEELLAQESVEDEENTQHLMSASETAGLVELCKEVLHLVTICNEASKTATGTEIFKPTTRLLEVFADLPWLVARDRKQLAEVVDCLYFVFYEGAGKDNLRFMSDHGGPLGDGDCDLIWCIKHLRNKWTRHDADHGREKDVLRSWNDLAAKFRWLDLSEHPTEPTHFRFLQRRLLEESMAFLRLILAGLTMKR